MARRRRDHRDQMELGVAEDLVAPAADRVADRRHHTAQDVACGVLESLGPVLPGGERGTDAVECCGPVVRQGRIVAAQRGGDRGVALVAGRADGVEALVEAAQPARGEIEVTAGELGVEQFQGTGAGQRDAVADRVAGSAPVLRGSQGRDRFAEPLVEALRGGHEISIADRGEGCHPPEIRSLQSIFQRAPRIGGAMAG